METRIEIFLVCVLAFNSVNGFLDDEKNSIVDDLIANHPIIKQLLERVEFLEAKGNIHFNTEVITDLKIRLDRCDGKQYGRTDDTKDKNINNSGIVHGTALAQRLVKPSGRMEDKTNENQKTLKSRFPDDEKNSIAEDAIANHPIIKQLLARVDFLEAKDKVNSETISGLKIRLDRCDGKQNGPTDETMDRKINNSSGIVNQTSRAQWPVKPSGRVENKTNEKPRTLKTNDGNNRIRQVNEGDTVAFFARSTTADLHIGPNQNIIFEEVPTNLGNGYNNHHGIFIAPISGTYLFSTTVLSNNNAEIWVHIAVNGVSMANAYARGTDGRHDSGSQTIIMTLTQGDDVAVQSNYKDENIFGGSYTTFSGFLLSSQVFEPVG